MKKRWSVLPVLAGASLLLVSCYPGSISSVAELDVVATGRRFDGGGAGGRKGRVLQLRVVGLVWLVPLLGVLLWARVGMGVSECRQSELLHRHTCH